MTKKIDYAYVASTIYRIHKAYGLDSNKITNTITDGGSNMCKAFRVFGQNNVVVSEIPSDNEESSDDEDPLVIEDDIDAEIIRISNILIEEQEDGVTEIPEYVEHVSMDLSFYENVDLSLNQSSESDNEICLPPQMRCFSHLLALTAKDFEKALNETTAATSFNHAIKKLKRFWSYTRRSSRAKAICKNICGVVFQIPGETRWNSLFDSISKVVKLNEKFTEVFDAIATQLKPTNWVKIKPIEIAILKDYVNCMHPLAILLDILQGDQKVSVGFVLPGLYSLKMAIADAKVLSKFGDLVKDTLTLVFNRRFENIMKISEENKNFIFAAISHPKFKMSWVPLNDTDFVREMFLVEYSIIFTENLHPAETNEAAIDSNHDFFRACLGNTTSTRNASLELMAYLNGPSDLASLHQYPAMLQMHIKYNTSLPASGSIERIFSQALMVNTPRRNRIHAKTFERLLFVKKNIELLNYDA